eukprot:4248429-Pyramimonas_sp.AAC.1
MTSSHASKICSHTLNKRLLPAWAFPIWKTGAKSGVGFWLQILTAAPFVSAAMEPATMRADV